MIRWNFMHCTGIQTSHCEGETSAEKRAACDTHSFSPVRKNSLSSTCSLVFGGGLRRGGLWRNKMLDWTAMDSVSHCRWSFQTSSSPHSPRGCSSIFTNQVFGDQVDCSHNEPLEQWISMVYLNFWDHAESRTGLQRKVLTQRSATQLL